MNGWRGTLIELIYALILWIGYTIDNIFTFRIAKRPANGAGEEQRETRIYKCKSSEQAASPAPTPDKGL